LFYPFLKLLGDFLEKSVAESGNFSTFFLSKEIALIPELAIDALEKETELFLFRVIYLNMEAFHLSYSQIENESINNIIKKKNLRLHTYSEKYIDVKQAEGEILSFYLKMREEKMEKKDQLRIEKLIMAVRNAMYSAKGFKDVYEDRLEFRNSIDNIKYQQYKLFQSQLNDFYSKLISVLNMHEMTPYSDELKKILGQAQNNYESSISSIYKQGVKNILEEVDISTLLNVNRRLNSSCRALTYSIKDYLLDPIEAESFENILIH
jgi:phosphate:Na+ symporter